MLKALPFTYCFTLDVTSPENRKARLKALADAGGKHIVLGCELMQALLRYVSLGKTLERELDEFGISFSDAHAPFGPWDDPGNPLEEYRKIIALRAKCYFPLCRMMKVDTVTFHTGNTLNSLYGKFTLDDYWKALICSLEEMLPEAEKNGVVIALENQWTPLNHSRFLVKAVRHFSSPYLGLCLDTGHANLMIRGRQAGSESCVPRIWDDLGADVEWDEEVMETMAPYLVNCHLHDNDGCTDQHRCPGDGNVDWDKVRTVLSSAPRLRVLQSEAGIPAGEDGLAVRCRIFRELFGVC